MLKSKGQANTSNSVLNYSSQKHDKVVRCWWTLNISAGPKLSLWCRWVPKPRNIYFFKAGKTHVLFTATGILNDKNKE